MARTVLREFTGGVSNEIDPQNLRKDQGQESLDINLKGFALEPGEGKEPIEGGNYYYRGEWIKDSKAVSFEESGIGVIKTFNEKRPEFEEIIKDDVNTSRSLGPPLPPSAVITGTVASEGTRGERPAEGSHLLKLPETALGGVDSSQSLITYEADSTTIAEDIHYYNGQAYWLVKSGSDWKVVTRAKNNDGEFTSTDVESAVMTHNSKGSFFRKGYFVCWDDQYIDSVPLSNTSMATIDSFNTIDPNDGGDAGSAFATNAGGTFTSGATSNSITGVNIDDNAVLTFSQRITTANTVPSEYTDSAKERWLRMPSGSNGCFVVLIRDGAPKSDSEANGKGNYTETDDDVEVWTDKNKAVFKASSSTSGWISPSDKLTAETFSAGDSHRWVNPKLNEELAKLGDIPYGLKYGVVLADNDTWVRIKYVGAKYPEILVIPNATANKGIADPVGEVYATRKLRQHWRKWEGVDRSNPSLDNRVIYYQDYIDIELIFPSVYGNNSLKWTYKAPTGDSGRHGNFYPWGGYRHDYSSYALNEFTSPALSGKYGWTHWNPHTFYFDLKESWISNVTAHTYPSGGVAGTWTKYYRSFNSYTKATSQLGTNNIATPNVPGKMNRLCSHVRGSNSTTQRKAFSVSELWTTAKFASADNSLAFTEATNENFRVGDWIKIGQNGSNKSLHLNLRGTAKDSTSGRVREQTFITAQIIGIETGVKLLLSPPEIDHLGTGKYLDEDCYPLITGFIYYNKNKKLTQDKPNGDYPVCAVLNKDTKYAHGTGTRSTDIDARELNENVLVGHGVGRSFNLAPFDYNKYGTRDLIEVRGAAGVEITAGEEVNHSHRISWSGADSRRVGNDSIRIPHAIRAAGTTTAPKIYYTKGTQNRMLYAQNGKAADTIGKKVSLSAAGGYYVDGNYLTHFDDKGVTVFSTDLSAKVFVKGNPRLSDGLGLTGNVTDAKHFVDSSNAVWVFVKIGDYWKIVKTSNDGPQSSLLSYDFKKAIGFDSTGRIWGVGSDSTDGWDIQYVTPFFEDNIIGSWIFYANSYTTVTPTVSAWGQVINFRVGKREDSGTPRYLSIDWKMDSGVFFGTNNPTIGLNHETQKMTSEETWKWYPKDIPSDLTTSGTGTVIANISGVTNTYDPLATIEVPFKSKIIRDVIFFKETETLPSSGDTGGEHKISFLNYSEGGQSFYVLSDNAFSIVERVGFEKEKAYKLGQTTTGSNAFDASKVGISSFLIGAPNMFNAYGPNIDLYYRASFVNKWGHESAPSPLSSKGITALDSSDDCIQVSFSEPFFRFDDTDIEKIRLYRYGGDSSEFVHLADIEMPTLPVNAEGKKYFPTYTNLNSTTLGFSRKSATSPYYLFKTYTNITDLSEFTNSNFMFTATPTTMDGSWRINQVSESDGDVIYLSGIGSAGDGEVGGDGDSADQYKHELDHSSSHVTGTAAAVGHFITNSKFLTGTKVTVVNNTGNYYFSPGALALWEPQDHGQTERGRAFEFTIPKDHTIHEVRVGGVATTAYTVTNFNGAVNEIEGISGSDNYINDGTFQVDIDGGNQWQTGQTHTDVDVHIAANAGSPGTSGGGTGAKFRIVTVSEDYLDNITITDMGEGYQVGDTIKVTDDGSTSYTVTVTVKSVINHDLITFDTPPPSGTNNIEIVTRLQTKLTEKLNTTDTTIKLTGRTGELNTLETAAGSTNFFSSPRHGLKHGQKIRLSTSDTLPVKHASYGFDLLEDTDYWVSLTDTNSPLPDADDDALTLYNSSSINNSISRMYIIRNDHGIIPYSYGLGQHYFHAYLEDDDAWPTSGVVKIGTEYISYTGISGNNLTGCVRGVYNTEATEHNTSRREIIGGSIASAGTGYGNHLDNTFVGGQIGISSFINDGGKLRVTFESRSGTDGWGGGAYPHGGGLADNTKIVFWGDDLPSPLVAGTVYYIYSQNQDAIAKLRTSSGGAAISYSNSGSGTNYCSAMFLETTGGVGSGFIATYDVNSSTGAITSITIKSNGYYSTLPTAFTPTDPYNSSYGTTAATGASITGFSLTAYDPAEEVIPVNWELEMEHRNQDTTTLTEAITSPLTGSANVLKVTDTSVFPSASANTSGGNPGPKKLLIGGEILTYTGKTDTTFTGVTGGTESTAASAHGLNVLVRSYDEVYNTSTVTNATIEIEDFGYRDKARTPISSLHYMQEDNFPPLGLEYNEEKKQFFETESQDDYFRYIKAVGSMYFGALDGNLRFSKYGTPEYWPVDAVVTLDSEIRWIEEHAGEGIVFTTNSVYRVRGTDPRAMIAFRVPDAKGVPAGYEHTVSDINGGLMWLTASDGLAMYSAGKVVYVTRDKHDLGRLKNPYSCVVDGEYWIFQEPGSGVGYRLDLTTGDLRLSQVSIEAYYAYFAKALGVGVVVTSDPVMSGTSSDTFIVEEIGGAKANNIEWRSKRIDAGEPAIPKALGSIAIVYEALNSTSGETIVGGIRGQALAAELLGLDPDDLDAGDISVDEPETITDLYSIFTKYDEPNQTYIVDTDGVNLTTTQRRTILMPVGFDTSSLKVGDRVWNELLADNTVVESLTTTTISSVVYPSIVVDKEPLRTGQGRIYWGNLPLVEIYLDNDDDPARSFTLPPGDDVEPQSMDLYLKDLKRFRTLSVGIKGDVRVQSLSVRHYPLQTYQSSTLHHSADVFYKGDVDFRVMLDGNLVYRKELNNAGDDFKEERIYLPASTYGQRAHYFNESRSGMIESVNFNGAVAA